MYYWDLWSSRAEALGVPAALASLGRELMREVAQHGHDSTTALGTEDDGPYMLAMCLQAPLSAEQRFSLDLASYSGVHFDEVDAVVHRVMAEERGCSEDELEELLRSEVSAVAEVNAHILLADDYPIPAPPRGSADYVQWVIGLQTKARQGFERNRLARAFGYGDWDRLQARCTAAWIEVR